MSFSFATCTTLSKAAPATAAQPPPNRLYSSAHPAHLERCPAVLHMSPHKAGRCGHRRCRVGPGRLRCRPHRRNQRLCLSCRHRHSHRSWRHALRSCRAAGTRLPRCGCCWLRIVAVVQRRCGRGRGGGPAAGSCHRPAGGGASAASVGQHAGLLVVLVNPGRFECQSTRLVGHTRGR